MTGTKDYEQEQCWRANEWMGLERAASGEHKTNPEVLFFKKKVCKPDKFQVHLHYRKNV